MNKNTIIGIGLFLIYIISCIIVLIYRKLKVYNLRLSSVYAVFLSVLLISILVWAYYPRYLRSLELKSIGWCRIMMAEYCTRWVTCNYTQECRPKDIPFEMKCVKEYGLEDLRNLNAYECR